MAGIVSSTGKTAYLSKEQFYKECHISKATALWLIQSGLIPAIDTKKKTNRYLIARDDVEDFKRDRENNPSKYAIAAKHNISTYGGFGEYKSSAAGKMKKVAQAEWKDMPEVLLVTDVAYLLGYHTNTIYRWTKNRGLQGLRTAGKLYIPKKYLLEFIASREYHSVHLKSSKHIDLLRRSYHAG